MNKFFKQALVLTGLIVVLILPYFVFAADPANNSGGALDRLKIVAEDSGNYAKADETSFAKYLGTIVSAFLSLLGVIFVILIIYAGYNWMTASGEADKVEKAKKTIARSITGLIITISAYAIWALVVDKIFVSSI